MDKKLIIKAIRTTACIASLIFAITACSTMTKAEKAERDARIAQAVEKALSERHYSVEVNMMYPRRGRAVNITPDYCLQVKGDTLMSYLPYFGRAYNVPYGGGKGLNFTATIKDYRVTEGRKGDKRIDILVDNDENIITYSLDVFSNGNTSIDVTSRNREPISYSGRLVE